MNTIDRWRLYCDPSRCVDIVVCARWFQGVQEHHILESRTKEDECCEGCAKNMFAWTGPCHLFNPKVGRINGINTYCRFLSARTSSGLFPGFPDPLVLAGHASARFSTECQGRTHHHQNNSRFVYHSSRQCFPAPNVQTTGRPYLLPQADTSQKTRSPFSQSFQRRRMGLQLTGYRAIAHAHISPTIALGR